MGGLFSRQQHSCVFCDIIKNNHNQKILASNEKFVIFEDLYPATEHHYLLIPRQHITNPKTLNSEHIALVNEMELFAREFLEGRANKGNFKPGDLSMGFHWPPFITVPHLHLHVIYPASTMSWKHSLLFKSNSWYFVTPQQLVKHLKSK